MNGTGDIPLTNGATPERPCVLTSYIPSLGMSCRGRAEAFARRLQSKLRTLGSQSDESPTDEEVTENGEDTNGCSASDSWLIPENSNTQNVITNHQPLRNDVGAAASIASVESFFDFDCELESPGSPAEECEYSRLIETASNTPLSTSLNTEYINEPPPQTAETRVGACTSSPSSSSPEDRFFDPDNDSKSQNTLTDFYDCEDSLKATISITNTTAPTAILTNGFNHEEDDSGIMQNGSQSSSGVGSDTLPNSQEGSLTSTSPPPEDKEFVQDNVLLELQNQSNDVSNGYHEEERETETKEEETNNHCVSSGVDTEDEEEMRPQRIRRCSSLKTGKTPPGTPGRKKFVRFADVLGLDLADVKTFMDEIPSIPKSAFEDLEINETEPPVQLGPKADKILMPLFQQPGGLPNFLDAVRDKQVSLENAAVSDHFNLTIAGSVRVRNLDFHKSVHIRYTLDGWRSFADLQGNYVQNSCDGFSDKFTFVMFGNSMHVGQTLEFAVRFQCKGQQFWDNNYGANYCFQCLPSSNNVGTIVKDSTAIQMTHHGHQLSMLSPGAGDAWCASFY